MEKVFFLEATKGFDGQKFYDMSGQKLLRILKIEILDQGWVSKFESQDIPYTLKEYIDLFFGGSQIKFAELQEIQPAQVTQWLKKDFIVVGNKMYSFRKELN